MESGCDQRIRRRVPRLGVPCVGRCFSFARNGFRRKLLRLNPAIRAGVEQVERENAAIQHLIVEGADVELGTQFLPCTFAKLEELELPDLVTNGNEDEPTTCLNVRVSGTFPRPCPFG
jgi:hypothetical protein